MRADATLFASVDLGIRDTVATIPAWKNVACAHSRKGTSKFGSTLVSDSKGRSLASVLVLTLYGMNVNSDAADFLELCFIVLFHKTLAVYVEHSAQHAEAKLRRISQFPGRIRAGLL